MRRSFLFHNVVGHLLGVGIDDDTICFTAHAILAVNHCIQRDVHLHVLVRLLPHSRFTVLHFFQGPFGGPGNFNLRLNPLQSFQDLYLRL